MRLIRWRRRSLSEAEFALLAGLALLVELAEIALLVEMAAEFK
jgi:hypothetical protein